MPQKYAYIENAKISEHKTRDYPEIQPYGFFIQYLVQPVLKKIQIVSFDFPILFSTAEALS